MFIVRTVKGRKLPIESKWLKGHVDKADVIDEATILLGDPRDTIQTVSLWSVKEEQFVDTIKRREVR